MEKPKQLPMRQQIVNVIHDNVSYGRIIATGKGNVKYSPSDSEAGRKALSAKGSVVIHNPAEGMRLVQEAKDHKQRILERGGKKEAARRARQIQRKQLTIA